MSDFKNKWIQFFNDEGGISCAYVIRNSVMEGLYLAWIVGDTVGLIESDDIIEEIDHARSLILEIKHGDEIHKRGHAYRHPS